MCRNAAARADSPPHKCDLRPGEGGSGHSQRGFGNSQAVGRIFSLGVAGDALGLQVLLSGVVTTSIGEFTSSPGDVGPSPLKAEFIVQWINA